MFQTKKVFLGLLLLSSAYNTYSAEHRDPLLPVKVQIAELNGIIYQLRESIKMHEKWERDYIEIQELDAERFERDEETIEILKVTIEATKEQLKKEIQLRVTAEVEVQKLKQELKVALNNNKNLMETVVRQRNQMHDIMVDLAKATSKARTEEERADRTRMLFDQSELTANELCTELTKLKKELKQKNQTLKLLSQYIKILEEQEVILKEIIALYKKIFQQQSPTTNRERILAEIEAHLEQQA